MSLGPFLKKLMHERRNYIRLREVTPKRDKPTRARAIQGWFALGRVFVPKFTKWWPDAEHQLLTFPSSSEDDFVDAIAHLGNEIETMTFPEETITVEQPLDMSPDLTWAWVKGSVKRREKLELVHD